MGHLCQILGPVVLIQQVDQIPGVVVEQVAKRDLLDLPLPSRRILAMCRCPRPTLVRKGDPLRVVVAKGVQPAPRGDVRVGLPLGKRPQPRLRGTVLLKLT